MSLKIAGVACTELWREGRPESGRESFDRVQNKIRATRVIECQWSSRLTVIRNILGGVNSTGGFEAPKSYPDIPQCLAMTCDVEGIGKSGQAGTDSQVSYAKAALTFNFETPDFEVVNNPNGEGKLLIEESLDYNAEFVTIPSASFVWNDSVPLPTDATPGKIMGMAEYTIVVHRHPNPPWNTITGMVGKLNDGAFKPLHRTFEDGKLLFVGTHDSRQFVLDPTGQLTVTAYNVTYKFAFRTERWNTAWRPDAGQFQDFQTPAGQQLYKSGKFNTLF